MSKKVLILSASPRKGGNSDLLCNEFLRGAEETGHQTEKIFVSDKKINYCTGCYACNGKADCVQKDDMSEVLKKMLAADVIVMATPVYFYTMDAQMKTLIDRTVARYLELSDKEFYFIVTAADTDIQAMSPTIEGFRAFTSCLDGTVEKGIIYGVGAWDVGDIKGSKAMQHAYDMGRNV